MDDNKKKRYFFVVAIKAKLRVIKSDLCYDCKLRFGLRNNKNLIW